jgi:lipid-A-disaccharide synthase
LKFVAAMTDSPAPEIAMVAGETSGDLLASLVIPGLQQRWPRVSMGGIGGPRMQQSGFSSWWPMEKLSVRGYVEVLKHYREIVGIRRQLKTRLLENRPDIFIGIDAPDFNLDLAFDLRQAGLKTVQFVCPSVWAWRAKRLKKIRDSVDHVLCIFPFEPELLSQHGIAATFVGHPLANLIPEHADKSAARAQLGLPQHARMLAVLPGSRKDEIMHLLPRFLAAVEMLRQQQADLMAVLPVAPGMSKLVHEIASKFPGASHLKIISGQSHAVMAAADVAMVASGTATLEAALFKCPMVIAYAMPWLSWQIIERKRLQPWVGLPNILCREFVVPELLQSQATPAALANCVTQWLEQPVKVEALRQTFSLLHQSLRADTPRVATDAIAQILQA